MTVKSCEKLEKSRVALTIETSAEEFEAAVNKAYLKMRGKINVPGFRVGKAPARSSRRCTALRCSTRKLSISSCPTPTRPL